jgi:hypothetical protein
MLLRCHHFHSCPLLEQCGLSLLHMQMDPKPAQCTLFVFNVQPAQALLACAVSTLSIAIHISDGSEFFNHFFAGIPSHLSCRCRHNGIGAGRLLAGAAASAASAATAASLSCCCFYVIWFTDVFLALRKHFGLCPFLLLRKHLPPPDTLHPPSLECDLQSMLLRP